MGWFINTRSNTYWEDQTLHFWSALKTIERHPSLYAPGRQLKAQTQPSQIPKGSDVLFGVFLSMVQPGIEDRARECQRPNSPVVMYQDWDHLLFLHWQVPSDLLTPTLPPGLHLDTFENRAFLGVVPFYMNNIRPRFCPTVPGISNFLEMNLRTYVHDDQGRPGVWFYSLDANQSLAVGLARRLFLLPYQHAEMRASIDEDGWVDYHSKRAWTGVESNFLYRGNGHPQISEPGTLEYFLAERYLLFTSMRGRLWSGRVYHTPYPLETAEVKDFDEKLLMLNGFEPSGRQPDYAHYSRGVKVEVFPLMPN